MSSTASSSPTPPAPPHPTNKTGRAREGTRGRLQHPARPAQPRQPALRTSHFPDPRRPRYPHRLHATEPPTRPPSPTPLDTEGSQSRAARSAACLWSLDPAPSADLSRVDPAASTSGYGRTARTRRRLRAGVRGSVASGVGTADRMGNRDRPTSRAAMCLFGQLCAASGATLASCPTILRECDTHIL
jgi:hypothetical protein